MKSIVPNPRIALIVKIGFLLFAVFATFAFFSTNASWRGLSFVLAISLAALFFVRERIDDERVHSLKLKALNIGFGCGFVVTLWRESQYNAVITAYDFICITLLTALVFFHFWRWQDGKASG